MQAIKTATVYGRVTLQGSGKISIDAVLKNKKLLKKEDSSNLQWRQHR